jgi:UDP-GlcNAc:undecaprenyl-phosphate GlcNAc-1-phosphate transferase
MLVLLAVGVWDDRSEIHYGWKFGGQMLAVGLFLATTDIRIESLTLGVRQPLPEGLSAILTAIFLIGVTNAINLSDGLDGLAGGMVLLCCCGIALLAFSGGDRQVVVIALVLAGAIVGFLRYNTHPARVFMGDAGSQLLGFSTGVLAITATQGETTAVSAGLPLLLVGVPILDTLNVMWIRIRSGRSPFAADRNHLHHRLLALGFSHGEAVLAVYSLQAVFFLLAYLMRFQSDLAIAAVYVLIATLALGSIAFGERVGWRAREGQRRAHVVIWSDWLRQSQLHRRIPVAAELVLLAAIALYSLSVTLSAEVIGTDIALLALVLLVLLLVTAFGRARATLYPLARTVAYVTVVTIVYIDQRYAEPVELMTGQTWFLLSVAAVAILVRVFGQSPGGFRVTTLDGLVVFLAVLVPQLLDPFDFATAFGDGLSKAVILLYTVELWLAGGANRLAGGILLGVVLAVLVAKAMLPATQL